MNIKLQSQIRVYSHSVLDGCESYEHTKREMCYIQSLLYHIKVVFWPLRNS